MEESAEESMEDSVEDSVEGPVENSVEDSSYRKRQTLNMYASLSTYIHVYLGFKSLC